MGRRNPDNSSLNVYLSPPLQQQLKEANGARPMLVLKFLIARLARLNASALESDYRMALQEVAQITSSFGGADKLVNTPSPNFYLYLLFLVYFYWAWFLLPWCLASYNSTNYWQPLVESYLISYTFGYLVFIAIDMDDPFDGGMVDLPLEKYEAGLNRDLNVVLLGTVSKKAFMSSGGTEEDFNKYDTNNDDQLDASELQARAYDLATKNGDTTHSLGVEMRRNRA